MTDHIRDSRAESQRTTPAAAGSPITDVTTQARDRMQSAAATVRRSAETVAGRIEGMADSLSEENLYAQADRVADAIRRNPGQALFICLVAGFLLARLTQSFTR
jgi:hypothetical protein